MADIPTAAWTELRHRIEDLLDRTQARLQRLRRAAPAPVLEGTRAPTGRALAIAVQAALGGKRSVISSNSSTSSLRSPTSLARTTMELTQGRATTPRHAAEGGTPDAHTLESVARSRREPREEDARLARRAR